MKRKNYNLMIGGAITLFFLAVALIGQFWTPYGTTTMDSMAVNLAPCAAHPLGTDNFGRDILSRVMAGSGSTFFVAVCTVLIGCVFGTIVGALTGYFGGFFDNLIMRFNDILLSFPSILLALIFISLTKPGSYNIILALGILFIPSFARIVRSEVIRCRELDFVKSARILGAGHIRVIFAHILPNAAVSLLTAAAIGFNNAVLAEASMSYLGNPAAGAESRENALRSAVVPVQCAVVRDRTGRDDHPDYSGIQYGERGAALDAAVRRRKDGTIG